MLNIIDFESQKYYKFFKIKMNFSWYMYNIKQMNGYNMCRILSWILKQKMYFQSKWFYEYLLYILLRLNIEFKKVKTKGSDLFFLVSVNIKIDTFFSRFSSISLILSLLSKFTFCRNFKSSIKCLFMVISLSIRDILEREKKASYQEW